MSIVLIMIAFACMSRAIGKKGEDIPATGFSVLAISQGIFFSAIPLTGSSNYEAIAGAMFYLPAMIMICFSRTFPLWVRIYGIVSSAPFLYIMFAVQLKVYEQSFVFENVLFLLFQVLTFFWAWFIWRSDKQVV